MSIADAIVVAAQDFNDPNVIVMLLVAVPATSPLWNGARS